MALLIVHHDKAAGLGGLARSLEERSLEVTEVEATLIDSWPDPAMLSGVLILGGRMSVAGTDHPGWVTAELDFLRAAETAEVPVFGICLGAQLLALAHGGQVAVRETPEVAVVAVHRTAPGRDDAITAGWPDGAPGLMFHEDEVVRLPAEAEQLLLGSDGATMWRLGHARATQMHPEVDAATLTTWIEDFGSDTPARAGVDADVFLAEAKRRDAFIKAAGISLVIRWIDQLDG